MTSGFSTFSDSLKCNRIEFQVSVCHTVLLLHSSPCWKYDILLHYSIFYFGSFVELQICLLSIFTMVLFYFNVSEQLLNKIPFWFIVIDLNFWFELAPSDWVSYAIRNIDIFVILLCCRIEDTLGRYLYVEFC